MQKKLAHKINFTMYAIQSKITRYTNKQENMTYNEYKRIDEVLPK